MTSLLALFTQSSFLTFVVLLFLKTNIIFPLLTVLGLIYFGPVLFFKLIVLFLTCYLLGEKIYVKNRFVGIVTSLLLIIQTHTLFSFIIGTQNSQNIIFILQILIILLLIKSFNSNLVVKIKTTINSLNIFEIFLICFSFILSSQPQSAWDSSFANLYNAKWYYLNNSLNYLPESISSLFPQNAIIYYSYFFGMGKDKALQISYLLPLYTLILFFRSILSNIKNRHLFQFSTLLLLLTPITIFESTNGYYDLLITVICLFAIFTSFTKNYYHASFLIGFAAGIKFFPITLGLIPFLFILYQKQKSSEKFKQLLISIILIIFSVSIWGFRSYKITGNPSFPFFQNLFPTPRLWSPSDRLENNYMIKTTMSIKNWILGGFTIYPLKTYTNSGEFIEGGTGYPTRAPIIFNTISLILIISVFYKYIRQKSITTPEIVLCLSYFCFIVIGLFTRYYRYLWPYQFTITFISIYLLSQKIKKNILISIFLLCLILLNSKNIYNQLRFSPIEPDKFFQPDYYQSNNSLEDPIIYINKNHLTNKYILDASSSLLHRYHLNQRVYECNWYWIMGQNEILKKDSISNFEYIVLSTKPFENYCTGTINEYLPKLFKVFEDKDYLILKL